MNNRFREKEFLPHSRMDQGAFGWREDRLTYRRLKLAISRVKSAQSFQVDWTLVGHAPKRSATGQRHSSSHSVAPRFDQEPKKVFQKLNNVLKYTFSRTWAAALLPCAAHCGSCLCDSVIVSSCANRLVSAIAWWCGSYYCFINEVFRTFLPDEDSNS